jgi:hypothetical protein
MIVDPTTGICYSTPIMTKSLGGGRLWHGWAPDHDRDELTLAQLARLARLQAGVGDALTRVKELIRHRRLDRIEARLGDLQGVARRLAGVR